MKRRIKLEPTLLQLREIAVEVPFEQVISWVYAHKELPPAGRWKRWRLQWQRWFH